MRNLSDPMKTYFSISLLLIFALPLATGLAYESASYSVKSKIGKAELRYYSSLPVVATSTSSGRGDSFGKLFRYIQGNNSGGQKIAMTTPVFMPSSSSAAPREMQFVLPKKVAAKGAPSPKDGAVRLKNMTAGTYAALRFKGYRDTAKQKAALAELRAAVQSAGYRVVGSPVFAYYNGPGTPEALRRNEVLLRVAK